MVKISFLEITARADFPTLGKPKLHLWEPTLQTLARQTMKDFEYIVLDVFWEERKDYFEDHINYGLRIKHVPAGKGSIWHDKGLCQVCHQFNQGIIHADGELLFFCADSNMLPPWLMESLWKRYQEGWFVSLGFGSDVSYGPTELQTTARDNVIETEWYRFLDFHGHVHMDHRYNRLFECTNRQWSQISPQWYYGISTASLEAMLKVNGFNECFDPDVTLADIDLGYRLAMAGYDKLAMFRDCYVVEAYAGTDWHPKMKGRKEVKCTNGLLWYNRVSNRFRANEPLGASDLDYIINRICRERCEVRDKCRTLPHRGPFYNKGEMELYEYWKKYGASYQVDLRFEREMRKDGTEYQEGTFINMD